MFKSYTSRARQSYSWHSAADYNPGAPSGRVTPGTQKQTTIRLVQDLNIPKVTSQPVWCDVRRYAGNFIKGTWGYTVF